ncbi:conserved hypothetical protein [Perkinsus marinus ATCC 50983]|uniref:cysteine desulfurase n=1 Tax=Perkinsus marinus (strain ATCC 50983 / TXsc) TaxID=423536 RepID=C5KE30_PERM5|nr:conserved hypothetical protein [Perkinsus marinus ATCC 50983]EER17242.1 conserved hypothetical protein [Perkinsus marinus ATCC 50983]|eukprot:XP_002785446.1 conserved hypothetical protein [Perkinsus marinus ATCC 50983]
MLSCSRSALTLASRAQVAVLSRCGRAFATKADQVEDIEYKRPAYFDNGATTVMDPRVLDAMLPYFCNMYGNPHSRSHAYGWEADDACEHARGQVASLIGANPKEIIFTSGATESNNLALKGVTNYAKTKTGKKHVITTQIEHKCVLASARALAEQNDDVEVTYLPVDHDGLINLKQLEEAIRPGETVLVSVMAVNNEIGVEQPLKKIGEVCRKHGVYFHTDCAQAVGKIPLDVNDMNIDLMSISGHKVYGPKGVGALYVRRRHPRVRMRPIIDGGGQERGLRSGTLATPNVVGFGAACEICQKEMDRDKEHVSRLARKLLDGIRGHLPKVILNGSEKERYFGNVNLSFSAVEGESLLMALSKDLCVSSGSACTSASLEPSYVLRAIGVGDDLAHTSLRFGIGRFTTDEEVDNAIAKVIEQVTYLRELSPLWEMIMEAEESGEPLPKVTWS